jgi:SAM-dependent methyltransferase
MTPDDPVGDAHFDAGWLALREPVDHRSRPVELLDPLREAWTTRGWERILDLGAGSGSNLRYLAPHLPGSQRWTLVDHDQGLLDRAVEESPEGDVRVRTLVGDLEHHGLESVADAHLVTASALLDLVSERWLEGLVARCSARGAGALLALSWDGTMQWSGPAHPDDHLVRSAVREHQLRNKGLGPALGSRAGAVAGRLFADEGYQVRLRPSPWVLTPEDRVLAAALVDGWEEAATEARPADAARIHAWARHRRQGLSTGSLVVGHLDLLALP